MPRILAVLASVVAACAAPARERSTPIPPPSGDGVIAHWSRGEPLSCGQACAPEAPDGEDPLESEALGYATLGQAVPDPDDDDTYLPPPSPVDAYLVIDVTNPGTIEGTVTWRDAPRAPAKLPGGDGCPQMLANPTLKKGRNGGVAGALVYLEGIDSGKAPAALGGVVENVGCAMVPHIQLAAPIGTMLVVANDDALPHSTVIRAVGAGRTPLFDEVLAARRQTEIPLAAAGLYQVHGDSSAATVGWVIVPRHPYYVLTDENGHFRLDDVPPGDYTIVAWHEPVLGALGRGVAAEVRTRVRVTAGAVAVRVLDLK